jgi:hypothetical protein
MAMKIYQFDGDLYCKPCGEAIVATLPEPTEWEREYPDSCSYPVAYDSSEGESDTPDHCGNPDCELFLERNLTEDGLEYVKEAARRTASVGFSRGHTCQYTKRCAVCIEREINEITQQWMEFYDIKPR